jgi:hypothetical protein
VEFINKPVQLTASASPEPAPSGGVRIPLLRRYVSVPGAAYDLHCAYLGEPAPRKVECESEQADALCLHKCAATASASLSMRGVRPAGSVWSLMQVYIAGDGCNSSSGPISPPPVESKAKPPTRL